MYSTLTLATLLPSCQASYVCHGSCLLTAVGCARCVSCVPALTKQDEPAIDQRADNCTNAVNVVLQFRVFLISCVYNLLYFVYNYLILRIFLFS